MIGKINKDGWLEIERAGKMKQQFCPLQPEQNAFRTNRCGDWCPHFGEPVFSIMCKDWELSTCKHSLYFKEFTDERVK